MGDSGSSLVIVIKNDFTVTFRDLWKGAEYHRNFVTALSMRHFRTEI